MTSALDINAQAITRRRFGQWGLVVAASGITGCGGGGGGDGGGEEPTVEPPAKAGALELVAGALGGGGFALQQGSMARLPDDLSGPAFNSQGDFQFVSGLYDCRVGRRSRQGLSSFSPIPSGSHGLLFDALDRYLVTGGGGRIDYLQGETPVRLAGGASDTRLIDGVGTGASLLRFDSPLLARDGLVYFIDEDSQRGFQPLLRTLGTDGTVKTLLPMPHGSQLLESPSGDVRRYTHSPYASEPKEWADLVLEGNAYQWRVLPSQWAFDQWTPLQKVQGSADVYWAFSGAQGGPEFSIAQIDLSGRSVAAGWTVRGGAVAVVAQGPSQANSASLFVVARSGLWQDGSEVVECRLESTGATVQRWLGLRANRGEADGQGQQARFDFMWGAEALPDGAGGLVVLEYRRGGSSDTTPVPALRSVSAPGRVSTWAAPPLGSRLAIAYGHLVGHEGGTKNALVRTPMDGQSAWQTWTNSSHLSRNRGEDVFLRTDTTGRLWFAKRYSPQPGAGDVYFGRVTGNSLVGTIDTNGQVQMVAGDPQALYTPQTYPPLAQRPWYMDIADMAFEGGAAQVSWVLCNRVELDGSTYFVRFHPELVRIDTQGIQRFALSFEIDPNLPESRQEPFKQICVLPGRPGEVFLSSACGIHRWTQSKGLELLAGQAEPTPGGVFTGPLPGGLNLVKFLAPGPDRRSLYVGSENSVLRLVLLD